MQTILISCMWNNVYISVIDTASEIHVQMWAKEGAFEQLRSTFEKPQNIQQLCDKGTQTQEVSFVITCTGRQPILYSYTFILQIWFSHGKFESVSQGKPGANGHATQPKYSLKHWWRFYRILPGQLFFPLLFCWHGFLKGDPKQRLKSTWKCRKYFPFRDSYGCSVNTYAIEILLCFRVELPRAIPCRFTPYKWAAEKKFGSWYNAFLFQ